MKDGRPSLTARSVALARSSLERPHTSSGDPAAEQILYSHLRTPLWWPLLSARIGRWVAARTSFFDQALLGALTAGITQIVIVGAGYDGRALRFREPGVRFFEVDHPATQEDKRRLVESSGTPAGHISYVPLDLTAGDLASALVDAGHDPSAPSLFVCEGLLLYLTPLVVDRLLRGLRACGAPGSLLALSARENVLNAPRSVRARDLVARLTLAAIGEPRRSTFAAGELARRLEQTGWAPVEQVDRGRGRSGTRGILVLAEPQ